jgi:hypothetical protein
MQVRRAHRAAAAAVLALALAGGCGQDGEVSLPTALPSVSLPTAVPSISLPEPSLSRPEQGTTPSAEQTTVEPTPEEPATEEPTTEEPAETPTESIIALPSDAPTSEEPTTEEPTTEPPSPEPTEEPTTPEETPTDEATSPTAEESATSADPTESTAEPSASAESPSPSESADVDEDAESGGVPIWLWVLGAAAIVAGIWWFLAARSRRRRWDAQLEVERAQARWVVDELLPTMTDAATAPSALAVHWAGAQATLDQLERGLAALVADPPDAGRLDSARAIAAATGEVRRAVTADLALRAGSTGIPADPAAVAASAVVVQAARDRLAGAIATPA